MKRFFSVVVLLSVVAPWWGCGGSGSAIPAGSKLFITPSDNIEVKSTSSVIQDATQLFIVAARDVPPSGSSTPAPAPGGTTTAAAALPGGAGVRDVGFSVTFEFTNPPAQQLLPDSRSAVTLCDGTRIINTQVTGMTDNDGNFSLCIAYKVGGGLSYSGRLIASSGDQSPSVSFAITAEPLTLAVSPSPSQTVPAGSLAQFTIVGGVPPYAVSASPSTLPPQPAVVTASGGAFLVAIPLGTPDGVVVTYAITDAVGAQESVSLTVGKPSSQPKVFPATSDVLPGGKTQFTIVDGFPPYTVSSSNAQVTPSPSTVAASGGTFGVSVPVSIQSGSITFTVRDSAGSSVDAKINVAEPPALKLSPTFVNVPAGDSALFVVTGGLAPYVVSTSDAALIASPSTILASGGTFRVSVPAGTPAETVTVTVTDQLGGLATASVNVIGVSPPMAFSPGSASVSGAAGGLPSFVITGGTAPYTVVSSDATRAFFGPAPGNPSVTGIANGGAVTVTVPAGAAPGAVTLTASDSANHTASVTITITP